MPVLDININNDTVIWNATLQNSAPAAAWNPALPALIRNQENGHGVVTAAAGYGMASFTYQSISADGDVIPQLQIAEGNEDNPVVGSSNQALVRATVVTQKMSVTRWM